MKIKSIIIVLIVLMISVVVAHEKLKKNKIIKLAEPLMVKIEKIKAIKKIKTLSTVGTLQSFKQTQLAMELSGIVINVYYHLGQHVNKNEPLIAIDNVQYKATVEKDEAALKLSQIKLQRMNKLLIQHLVSVQDIDSLQSTIIQQQAKLMADKAILAKTILRAPFAGIVAGNQISLGTHLNAGQSTISIVNNDNLYVTYHLPQNDIAKIQLNQPVKIIASGFKDAFHGYVKYISPSLDETSHTITILAIIPNASHKLLPGMSVTLSQEISAFENEIMIPEQSVIQNNNQTAVFIVKNNHAMLKPISINDYESGSVTVGKGLQNGDQLIISGQNECQSGELVKIMGEQ